MHRERVVPTAVRRVASGRPSVASTRQRRLWRVLGLFLAMALVVLALGVAPGIGAAQEEIEISDECVEINASASSSTVVLTEDIDENVEGQCINVKEDASNVHIDGQGHEIEFAQNGSDQGVYIAGENTIVSNVTIVGGIGVYVDNADGAELRNVEIRDAGARGIWIQGTSGTHISDTTVSGSGGPGIRVFETTGIVVLDTLIQGAGDRGILVEDTKNTQILDTVVTESSDYGVEIAGADQRSNNSTLSNVSAKRNGGGILVSDGDGHVLNDVSALNNDGVGIRIEEGAQGELLNVEIDDNGNTALDLATDAVTGSNVTLLSDRKNTTLSFTAAEDVALSPIQEPSSLPENVTAIDRYFELDSPDPDSRLDATLHYSDRDALQIAESTLRLWQDSEDWIEIEDSNVSQSNNTISASLNESGLVGAFGQGEPYFDVDALHTSSSVTGGNEITVQANVTNRGGVSDERNITFALNDSRWANETATIELNGSESQSITATWPTDRSDAGNYEVTVYTGDVSSTESIRVDEPANLTVDVLRDRYEVREDEQINVTATVENQGDLNATQELNLSIDGEVVDNSTVRVDASESRNVTLVWQTGDAGNYSAVFSSENDSDDASVRVKAPANLSVDVVEYDSSVLRGHAVDVTANVTNLGDFNASQTLELTLNGSDRIVTDPIELGPRESQNVTLTWSDTADYRGDYTLQFASHNDSETVDVDVDAPANLTVDVVQIDDEVVQGAPLNVTANVTNIGDRTADQLLNLTIEDYARELDTSDEVIEPGESRNVTLTWSNTSEVHGGEHTVIFASENDSDSERVRVVAPANLTVGDLEYEQPVVAGENATLSVNVSNVGDLQAQQNVTLSVDSRGEDPVATESAALNGTSSTTVSFEWTPDYDDIGNRTVTISTENDSLSEQLTVLDPANFTVEIVSDDPPVEAGEDLTVDALVENVGQAAGEATVALNVSGVRDEQTVTLNGSENATVALSWATSSGDAGNHTVVVDVGDDSDARNVSIEEPEDTGGGLPPGDGGDDGGLSISVDGTNSPVDVGDAVRVTATVTNTGSSSETETVELRRDGGVVDSATVTVAGESAETVELTWQTGAGDDGRQQLEVVAGASSATRWVTVNEDGGGGDRPALAVTIASTSDPVVERAPLTVTAELQAHEDVEQTVALLAPRGDRVDERNVSLSAGESTELTLAWQTELGDAGRGFLTVESEDDAATRSVQVEETPPFAVAIEDANSPVTVDETLTVEARVTSEAAEERRGYVTLETGEEVRDGRTLALEPGESRTLTLTWEPAAEDVGSTDVTVDVGADSDRRGVTISGESSGIVPFAPDWTGTAVDYAPTSQDTHVGAFFWLTLVLGGLGAYVLATRATIDARVLGATLLTAAARTGTDVLHATIGGPTLEPMLALNTALELYVGLLFLAFAAAHVEHELLLEHRSVLGLLGVAAVGTVAIVTNPLHGLVFSEVSLAAAPFTYVTAETGALGWAILSVTLVSILLAAGLLVQSFLAGTDPAWRPVGVLASGLCLALLVVALSVLERGPLPHYDYTGAGVGVFLALTTTTLFGHGLQRIKHNAQQSLIEDLEDPIVVANDQRVVVEYNDAAAQLLPGIAAGERFDRLVGYEPEWPAPGGTTTAEQSRSGLLPSRRSPDGGPEVVVPSEPGDADDAAPEVHYLVQTTSVTADTGDSIGYTVRFTDVTELKRRTDELERKNEQLEQVASTISHDLRNPLSVADGYVDILQDGVPAEDGAAVEPADVEQHLAPIRRAVDRMEAIIDDILALARGAEAVSTTEAVEFDEVVEEAWHTVDTDEATLFIESTGLIDADGQRLRRILENLFRNAVEHAGRDVAVVTGITDDGFYVADDGPGIPPDERDDVFVEGYTSSADGTGLGLAIVRQLAEAHDWTVALDDEYEEGARFEFSGAVTMAHRDGPTSAAIQND